MTNFTIPAHILAVPDWRNGLLLYPEIEITTHNCIAVRALTVKQRFCLYWQGVMFATIL